MQGVQPKPKAAPTINGKNKIITILISKNSYIFIHKIKNNTNIEKNIIIIPAMILKIFENKKNFPINEAVEPNAIKQKKNPK